MSDSQDAGRYLEKSLENITGAQSECVNGRFNNYMNRAYYACFQAAIAALLWENIRSRGGRWRHSFVQSQFAGNLVSRRQRYPSAMRSTLSELMVLRQSADYEPAPVNWAAANRALRRAEQFVEAVQQTGEVDQ